MEISENGSSIRLGCSLGEGIEEGDDVILSIRPENVRASHEEINGASIEGEVIQVIFLGNCVDCRVQWGEFEWKILSHPRENLSEGDKVYLTFDAEHALAVKP